jgi:hypothetical protein
MRAFENRVMKRISEPKKNEITGWNNMDNEEILNLYCSPNINIIRMMKSMRRRRKHEETTNAFRCADRIAMDLAE